MEGNKNDQDVFYNVPTPRDGYKNYVPQTYSNKKNKNKNPSLPMFSDSSLIFRAVFALLKTDHRRPWSPGGRLHQEVTGRTGAREVALAKVPGSAATSQQELVQRRGSGSAEAALHYL